MHFILLAFIIFSGGLATAEPFRFHLLSEPATLDPQSAAASNGNYLFQNLFRGLYRYHSKRGLILEGAKSCVRKPLRLVCHLNPLQKWSDGQPVVAADYVAAFRRLIDPDTKSPQSELILSLKNATEIWAGKLNTDSLGVRAVNRDTLEFKFAQEDVEFEYKLTTPATAPWPPTGLKEREQGAEMLFSGPYRLTGWKVGHWMHAAPNPHYALPAAAHRPDLEVLVVENDAAALGLYEAGKMSFLRRLTAADVPRYKGKVEFIQLPVARFDYVGFGPELNPSPGLRTALTQAVDFATFQRLFDTLTAPGCPSLPARFLDKVSCQTFQPEAARQALKDIRPTKLEFHFSRLGGDDIARAAEWFQGQWKKNLGLSVELKGEEQGVYLSHLRAKPPAIFRKGVSLERPTCLAALELFGRDHRENYLRFDDPEFEKVLRQLRGPLSAPERRRACRRGVEVLLGSHRLIPLGEMYFTLLASPKYRGWDLNELNQMDLNDLSEVP